MEQDQKNQTEQRIAQQIKQILDDLRMLGYPQLLKSQFSNKPQDLLSIYFQHTNSRFNLIQWLISLGFPEYKEEPEFQIPLNKTLNITQKLSSSLWKMGLMPFSRHTKTMDYGSYVEAMLGYENAVKLIHDLCKFARKEKYMQYNKNQRDQDDNTFGLCLHELIENYQTLINTDYDPYGITFPPAYSGVDDQRLDHQIVELKQRLQRNQFSQKQNRDSNNYDYEAMFRQTEQYRRQFETKVSQLVQVMRELRSEQVTTNPLKQSTEITQFGGNELVIQKTLNVAVSLCEKTKTLKKVKKLQKLKEDDQIRTIRLQIENLLSEMNGNIVL